MSAFDDDFAAAESLFAEEFGVSVTYLTATASIAWTAQVTLQKREVIGEHGAMQSIVSRDYAGDAAALGVTPESGHRIQETIGGVVRTFEIMPIADRECWEYADEACLQIIVRTKEVV